MKKAFILAYYFPPIAASGSLRPLGIARHLAEFGYEPTILTTPPECVYPPGGTDNSLLDLVPTDLHVVPIAYRNTLRELLALRDKWRPGDASNAEESTLATTAQTESPAGEPAGVSLKDLILDRLFLFPDHQKYWIDPVVQYCASLPSEARPDVILATANPWSSLVAGEKISRKLNVPWVADFRDPWWRNPKPQPNARLLSQVARLEARVFKSAARIVANTAPLAERFSADHPAAADKIEVVTNGYLPELVPGRGDTDTPANQDDVFEICHFGSVYPLRNPKELLVALDALAAAEPQLVKRVRLKFVGGWDVQDPTCDQLADKLEAQGLLKRAQSVPRQEVMRLMQQSSALLILQQDFPLQIPAKLYEYISIGRPIIAIGGKGATSELIESHGVGSCYENDDQQLLRMLKGICSGQHMPLQPSFEQSTQFEYRNIARKISEVLNSAL